MTKPSLWFEDFKPGETVTFGGYPVTEEEIVAFAREFDPQPVHVGDAGSVPEPPVASGWHSCGMFMRMMCDAFLLDSASMGSPGVEELRWIRPVSPGDVLSVRRTCLSTRLSKSRPDMGLCLFEYDVFNDRGETVMAMRVTQLFGRRAEAAARVA